MKHRAIHLQESKGNRKWSHTFRWGEFDVEYKSPRNVQRRGFGSVIERTLVSNTRRTCTYIRNRLKIIYTLFTLVGYNWKVRKSDFLDLKLTNLDLAGINKIVYDFYRHQW